MAKILCEPTSGPSGIEWVDELANTGTCMGCGAENPNAFVKSQWQIMVGLREVYGLMCPGCCDRLKHAPDDDPWLVSMQVASKLNE